MGFLSDLFVDRDKERKQNISRKLFDVRRSMRGMERHCDELSDKRDTAWNDARKYVASGQKVLARSEIQKYQRLEGMVGKINRKIAVVDHYITNLEIANTSQEMAAALGSLAQLMNIDEHAINDTFAALEGNMVSIENLDQQFDDIYGKNTRDAARNSNVSSEEELMAILEQEAGISVSGRAPVMNGQPTAPRTTVREENDALSRIANELNRKK